MGEGEEEEVVEEGRHGRARPSAAAPVARPSRAAWASPRRAGSSGHHAARPRGLPRTDSMRLHSPTV
eukprot:2554329-Pyramimonas_sp.AAC.1